MSLMPDQTRSFTITEHPQLPLDGKVFGWLPIAPMVIGCAVVAISSGPLHLFAASALSIWGSAILLFLAGVRRGLSFRTPGGVRAAQLITMLVYFCWALMTLVGPVPWSLWLLALGFLGVAVLDPMAARRAEAPLYFARLRPVQMTVAMLSMGLGALLS